MSSSAISSVMTLNDSILKSNATEGQNVFIKCKCLLRTQDHNFPEFSLNSSSTLKYMLHVKIFCIDTAWFILSIIRKELWKMTLCCCCADFRQFYKYADFLLRYYLTFSLISSPAAVLLFLESRLMLNTHNFHLAFCLLPV